jgi:hypothetical protein
MMLTVSAPDADAPVNRLKAFATVFTPVPMLIVEPAVLTFAMDTVGAPEPLAINVLFIPVLDPIVIAPV